MIWPNNKMTFTVYMYVLHKLSKKGWWMIMKPLFKCHKEDSKYIAVLIVTLKQS